MPIILPYYLIANPNFRPRISQHFGLEIDPEDIYSLSNYNPQINDQVRCPAGYLRQWQNLASQNDSGSNVAYDSNNFQVQLDVQQFTPDEISVKIENGAIVVEGQHAEKEDGQGFVSRHFVRKYDIPENCDADRIQSTLSSDGILTINIPETVERERVVPIQFSVPHADAA